MSLNDDGDHDNDNDDGNLAVDLRRGGEWV